MSIKQTTNHYDFSSQYQQNPTPLEGSMVRMSWLRYYEPTAPLPSFSMTLQSWDTANKSSDLNDYSVCTTWGYHDGKSYLLDVYRRRMDYPELKRAVAEQIAKFNPRRVSIEGRASGTQLIQELKTQGEFRTTAYDPPPQTDKVMRLHAQTDKFEAGNVLLPHKAPWLADFIKELTAFPGCKFDDQVDSTTQALVDHLSKYRSADIWAELGR